MAYCFHLAKEKSTIFSGSTQIFWSLSFCSTMTAASCCSTSTTSGWEMNVLTQFYCLDFHCFLSSHMCISQQALSTQSFCQKPTDWTKLCLSHHNKRGDCPYPGKCPKPDTGQGESFNIPRVRLKHKCGQILVTKSVIQFYLLSKKRARKKYRKGRKKWTITESKIGNHHQESAASHKEPFSFIFQWGELCQDPNSGKTSCFLALFHRDQSRKKPAKVAATTVALYLLHVFVNPLSESIWDRLTWSHLQDWGTIFQKSIENSFCTRSKKHKLSLESSHTALAWSLHLILCN